MKELLELGRRKAIVTVLLYTALAMGDIANGYNLIGSLMIVGALLGVVDIVTLHNAVKNYKGEKNVA